MTSQRSVFLLCSGTGIPLFTSQHIVKSKKTYNLLQDCCDSFSYGKQNKSKYFLQKCINTEFASSHINKYNYTLILAAWNPMKNTYHRTIWPWLTYSLFWFQIHLLPVTSNEAQEQKNPSVSVITTNSVNKREKYLWKWSQNCQVKQWNILQCTVSDNHFNRQLTNCLLPLTEKRHWSTSVKSVHVSFRLDSGIPLSPCPRDRVLTPSPSHPRKELRRRKSPLPGSHTSESSHDSTQQHSSSLESTEGTTRGKKYFTYGDIHSLKKELMRLCMPIWLQIHYLV